MKEDTAPVNATSWRNTTSACWTHQQMLSSLAHLSSRDETVPLVCPFPEILSPRARPSQVSDLPTANSTDHVLLDCYLQRVITQPAVLPEVKQAHP
ncbi:hypothetical protein [Thermosporothrix hazakensis]|uniref:hypothetical protein n=1 Tax=Thermosporothrix hazakensis TaxID=644383 RepID=UPI001B86560C|nr:hypothetical protein [Thermosporothrix hazakensis]